MYQGYRQYQECQGYHECLGYQGCQRIITVLRVSRVSKYPRVYTECWYKVATSNGHVRDMLRTSSVIFYVVITFKSTSKFNFKNLLNNFYI